MRLGPSESLTQTESRWRVGLVLLMHVFVHCWRMPLHLVRWGTCQVHLPPASIAAALCAEPQQWQFDQQLFIVRMCLAQVTLLPTALTKLTGTNCLEVNAGSVGPMSLPVIGGASALKTNA